MVTRCLVVAASLARVTSAAPISTSREDRRPLGKLGGGGDRPGKPGGDRPGGGDGDKPTLDELYALINTDATDGGITCAELSGFRNDKDELDTRPDVDWCSGDLATKFATIAGDDGFISLEEYEAWKMTRPQPDWQAIYDEINTDATDGGISCTELSDFYQSKDVLDEKPDLDWCSGDLANKFATFAGDDGFISLEDFKAWKMTRPQPDWQAIYDEINTDATDGGISCTELSDFYQSKDVLDMFPDVDWCTGDRKTRFDQVAGDDAFISFAEFEAWKKTNCGRRCKK